MTDEPQDKPVSRRYNEQGLLECLVAAILNEREVVLNVGDRDGVKEGMYFAILDVLDQAIKDPVTGEILGELPPREKIRVRVVGVEARLSVARTYHFRRVNEGGEGGFTRGLLDIGAGEPRYVDKPYTFRYGEGGTVHFKKISPSDSIVRVGDRCVQVVEEQMKNDN